MSFRNVSALFRLTQYDLCGFFSVVKTYIALKYIRCSFIFRFLSSLMLHFENKDLVFDNKWLKQAMKELLSFIFTFRHIVLCAKNYHIRNTLKIS